MNNNQKALEYFEKSLKIYLKFGKANEDLILSYNNIGSIYDSMNDNSKPLEYYEKSLNLSRELLGDEHCHTAMIYKNIADFYSK